MGTIKNKHELGYEGLNVWQKALEFAVRVIELVDEIDTPRKHYRLIEQLEAASVSVSMNIAEGKGRYSKKEFSQFCYISRGSLYETITLLEIFKRKNWITKESFEEIKTEATEIASMI